MPERDLNQPRVRMARPQEVDVFRTLVARSGVPVEREVAQGISDRTLGRSLLEAAAHGDTSRLRSAARNVDRYDGLLALFVDVSLALVAVTEDGSVQGALQGIAPGNLAVRLLEQGWPPRKVASLVIRAGKVSAVGVASDATRTGVGTLLLKEACRLYFASGFYLVYGYFRRDDPGFLEDFYQRAGFAVSQNPAMRRVLFGFDEVDIGVEADQKMFSLSRSEWRSQ